MENNISTIIRKFLDTEYQKYFEQLLERFSPLIKAYTKNLYYLEYEHSLQELNIAIYKVIVYCL